MITGMTYPTNKYNIIGTFFIPGNVLHKNFIIDSNQVQMLESEVDMHTLAQEILDLLGDEKDEAWEKYSKSKFRVNTWTKEKTFITNCLRDHPKDLLNPLFRKYISEDYESISNMFYLNENHINAEIYGREKTPFSIWRKVQKKRVSLEQITDIIGFRITLSSVDECYKTLGIFHKKWNCIPGKFKDYISSPKINHYKSLHTAVIGPNKRPIEIQIRTMEMHEFAERGIASHWQYKSSEKFNSLTWKEYDWLKDLLDR